MTKEELLREEAYRTLEKEGVFTPNRTEFLLSAIVHLLEILVSFKTTEEWTATKLDDHLAESSPRLVKKDKKRQAKRTDHIEKTNRDFMMTLKLMAENNSRRKPPIRR